MVSRELLARNKIKNIYDMNDALLAESRLKYSISTIWHAACRTGEG